MLHSKEVIENQFQHSIENGYDGTRQIADTTTSPKSSMKRQNQEYGPKIEPNDNNTRAFRYNQTIFPSRLYPRNRD